MAGRYPVHVSGVCRLMLSVPELISNVITCGNFDPAGMVGYVSQCLVLGEY